MRTTHCARRWDPLGTALRRSCPSGSGGQRRAMAQTLAGPAARTWYATVPLHVSAWRALDILAEYGSVLSGLPCNHLRQSSPGSPCTASSGFQAPQRKPSQVYSHGSSHQRHTRLTAQCSVTEPVKRDQPPTPRQDSTAASLCPLAPHAPTCTPSIPARTRPSAPHAASTSSCLLRYSSLSAAAASRSSSLPCP